MNVEFIKRYVFFVGFVWTVLCIVALYSHLDDGYRQSVKQATTRARTMLERDILYRNWIANHGGVYAPVTESSPPNPHLQFLPERDIETTDGRRLTLINPSYMTHQAFEMSNRADETFSKLTSLKYLNPQNAPDHWERSALARLAEGAKRVTEVVEVEGETFVRTIQPFYVEETCLKCHAEQGYELGDVRGGLSITVPFKSIRSGHWEDAFLSAVLFSLLWVSGLIGISLLGRKLHTQTQKAVNSDLQRDQAEMSLDYMANFDRRTNLPNRFKFEENLFELFKYANSTGGAVAVTTVEIRNYKQILDNFDHPVGDALLRLLAERIVVNIGPYDSVARFGEDRLLFSYSANGSNSISEQLIYDFSDEIAKPLLLEEHKFFPVVCMGTAIYPNDELDPKRLIQKSVSALSFCIEERHSGAALFSNSIQERSRRKLDIETGLRIALSQNSLDLYLQPQIDSSGALTGAEALLRWQREGQDYISPAEFVPVAEESGLILCMGEWVLRKAVEHALEMRERFGFVVPVGVNVSVQQFQDDAFLDIIDELLLVDGMSADMLEIEITESTFIDDIDRTIEVLTDLKVRGLQIAIDDFGTGYSSLSYLNNFPVDRLKIDRSFVANIANNEDDRVLVSLVTEMGRKLSLNVIAEGVEDEVQKNLLIGMGCHALQGFLFGKPMNFDEFCSHVKALQLV